MHVYSAQTQEDRLQDKEHIQVIVHELLQREERVNSARIDTYTISY